MPITSNESQLYPSIIKIAMIAHRQVVPTHELAASFSVPQLSSSICRMVHNQDDGTSRRWWDYPEDQLPLEFRYLDVWEYFCIASLAINDFDETETMSVYCRADRSHFTPVFIEVNPSGTDIQCTPGQTLG